MDDKTKIISRFLEYGWHDREETEYEILNQYRTLIKIDPFRSEFSQFRRVCEKMLGSRDGRAKLALVVLTSVEFYRSFENGKEGPLLWLEWFIEAIGE